MGKIINTKSYIVIIAILVCILIVLSFRSCFQERQIFAFVTVTHQKDGTMIHYGDSTKGAKQWRWDFGNGKTDALTKEARQGGYSTERTGDFFYPCDTVSQRYQIRLRVDDKLEKMFLVDVPANEKADEEELVQILAPDSGMQGEYVAFIGQGNSKEWRWSFGESGMVDAREKTAIYKYKNAGTFVVQLETEDTKYPITHTIVIEPQYTNNDTADVESQIGNDIKLRLQAIVDQKPFNDNYNYILNTYLCGNSNTPVVVNNIKKNDIYSYCQGLRIIGRKKTIINNVVADMDTKPNGTSCITKLTVMQTDLD